MLRMIAGLLALVVSAVSAAPVAVIQGKAALPVVEHRFAQSLANHAERWLKESGVTVNRADDTQLAKTLSGVKAAVLVYPGNPSSAQLAALESFTASGGRLIVCYSSSPALANLMGVKLGGYLKSGTDGRWSRMVFSERRPRGCPAAVRQSSANLFAVEPIAGRSEVLAGWENRQGRKVPEAAWLKTTKGWWFAHVLLADGDSDAKAALLLSLCAEADPSLWRAAASARIAKANSLLAATALTARAPDAAAKIRSSIASAESAAASGRAFEAWERAETLSAQIYRAYGGLQSPRGGEIRAVWDHSGMGLYPGNWKRTCAVLKQSGITDLFVNVAGSGFAHYASDVLPRSRVYAEQGDQLQACIDAARPQGIRVHAWILCFSTEGATEERRHVFAQKGWLLKDENGANRPWLEPQNPEVRAYLTAAVKELAGYRVDGVHLDFVRYPDLKTSLEGSAKAALVRRRVEAVTDFVQASRRIVKGAGKSRIVSAAVFGKYPSCVAAVGQDWEAWLRMGFLDYAAPMNYTEDMGRYSEWLGAQTRTKRQAGKIISGIGVTASESRLNPVQVVDQINLSRRTGCAGFALFDLDVVLQQEVLPVLRAGISRAKE